ncbi:MAG TPA: glycosyltransferase family 4 protein, partial [Thermoanaerobaculia bacterium]
GWKELIDSVSDVAPEHPEVHLALIGCRGEKEKNEVMAYARETGMAGRVSAIEYRSDMPNVFASCDLVVDASWAGTGITGTIREAMSMRKPVIATSAGGNGELVTSPDVGWLIPMKDRPALSTAIRAVIADPVRASAVAHTAREHVVRGYSKELRIERLERLYTDILTTKRLL